MSTAMPQSANNPLLLALGNQLNSPATNATGNTGIQSKASENSQFIQVLSDFLSTADGTVTLPQFLAGLEHGASALGQNGVGSGLPLEGNPLPPHRQSILGELAEIPLAVQQGESLPAGLSEELQARLAGHDALGLVASLVNPSQVDAALNDHGSALSMQPQLSAALATAIANRLTAEAGNQAAVSEESPQAQVLAALDLADETMFSDPEQGNQEQFLRNLLENRLANLPQAASEHNSQFHRESLVSLVNASAPLAATPVESARPASMPTLSLHEPFNHSQWRDEMANRISWLVRNNQSAAQLRINPAHLGPMEISINISQEQASVSFVSQHLQVREAVELAIPRLREMLEQQGLNLADVDISSGHSHAALQHAGSGNESTDDSGLSAGTSDECGPECEDTAQSATLEAEQSIGILDEYA